eukprot:COSAG06_NODE_271_length_18677_cov_157.113360_9_plen_96_part_00
MRGGNATAGMVAGFTGFWGVIESGPLVDRLGRTHQPKDLGLKPKTAIGVFWAVGMCIGVDIAGQGYAMQRQPQPPDGEGNDKGGTESGKDSSANA